MTLKTNSMKKTNYKEALEQLRQRYQNHEVSPLVGAGFSKNVSQDMFMSWEELLFDMVVELFSNEIRQAYSNRKHAKPHSKSTYYDFKKLKVREIIHREGYLNIVSKYIEHKGYREVVETYIEDRTPRINSDDDTLDLRIAKKKGPIIEENIALHKKLLSGDKWGNIFTTNYDSLLEYTSRKLKANYEIITERHQLSFSKTKKTIIKIHGDLSAESATNFEFDNDHTHRYIISKEDYDRYPANHEPFTQLMRISLLQGAFCLFGFSGDDPNFISWIKWVRDILVTAPNKNNDEFKVFLITIDDKEPTIDRQLFYNNHKIVVIPVMHKIVSEILEVSDSDGFKERLSKLFDFLYQNSSNYYNKLWSEVYNNNTQIVDLRRITVITIKENIATKIYEAKQFNRLIKYSSHQKKVLSDLYLEPFDQSRAKLFIYALKDTFHYPQYYPNVVDKIDNVEKSEELAIEWKFLKERYNTLKFINVKSINLKIENDSMYYENLLKLAFSFQFDQLREAVNRWDAEGHFLQKKAMMVSMFDREQAKDILLKYLDSNPIMIERYYATELLNRVNTTYLAQYPVSAFQNMNLEGLSDLTKVYVNEATKTKNELKPYGWSGTISYMQNNAEFESALRFMQFMIESGLRITLGCYVFINEKEWYKIFRNLFVFFPYPTLFYSIQCSNKDVLKRIGQDYAYEDRLQDNLPQILTMLLQYLLSENKTILDVRSVLIIAQELFIAVPPSEWEKQFMEIWDKILLENFEDIDRNDDWYKFANSGLKYIKTSKSITKIISDCLSHSTKSETIDYLYNLDGIRKRSLKVETDLQRKIDIFVDEISNDNEFVIAGNIYKLLNKKNLDMISGKIKKLKTKKSIDYQRLYSISYFAKSSTLDINIVKHIILSHCNLWDNGLLDKGATLPSYIALSRFGNNIKWTRIELVEIFHKLKSSFEKLSSSTYFYKNDTDGDIFSNLLNYTPLLDEMNMFLTKYKIILQTIEGYDTISKSVYSELVSRREYVDIYEALCSDIHSNVITGLNQMYRDTQERGFENYSMEINLLVDRILLKKASGLLVALEHAENYLKKYYVKELFTESISRKYLLMLKMYQGDTLRELELNVPYAIKWLVSISDILSKNSIISEDIDYWQNFKKTKRYNIFN